MDREATEAHVVGGPVVVGDRAGGQCRPEVLAIGQVTAMFGSPPAVLDQVIVF